MVLAAQTDVGITAVTVIAGELLTCCGFFSIKVEIRFTNISNKLAYERRFFFAEKRDTKFINFATDCRDGGSIPSTN